MLKFAVFLILVGGGTILSLSQMPGIASVLGSEIMSMVITLSLSELAAGLLLFVIATRNSKPEGGEPGPHV